MNERESNETKKKYLKSYEDNCKKLKSLEEQLKSLREAGESAKAQVITDMPSGGKQKDLSDYIVELENLEKKIKKKEKECNSKKKEIENCIIDVKGGLESMILYKKYIKIMKWEEICVDIGYSWRQTHRLHSSALKNLKINQGTY